MPGTILLRLPAASPLLAGPKIPKPRNRMPFLQVNTYLTSPTPLLFPSCSNPRHATIPIATSASDVSFPSAASFTLKTRWKLGSKPLPNLLQSGSEPLVAGDDGGLEDAGELRRLVIRVGEALSMAFPLWVSLACLLALWKPPTFLWVGRTWQIVGLTLTMLGMGMTLTLDDLRTALLMPRELAAGFVLQYTVMPMSGYLFSKLLKLPSYYAAGLILVACCPGGTASNIVTYLARGNVALSVLMTATSTFTAAVMTPFLTSKLAGGSCNFTVTGTINGKFDYGYFVTVKIGSQLLHGILYHTQQHQLGITPNSSSPLVNPIYRTPQHSSFAPAATEVILAPAGVIPARNGVSGDRRGVWTGRGKTRAPLNPKREAVRAVEWSY